MKVDATIWTDIRGYEGLYEVSMDGRIRSTSKIINCAYGKTRVMRGVEKNGRVDKKGYKRVDLYKENQKETWLVHRALMLSFMFIENHKSMDINHIDGNPSNNDIGNLEWCTHQENLIHARNVLKKGKTKPVSCFCKSTGQLIKSYQKMVDVKKDGHKVNGVSKCALGERQTHHGFLWRYA